MMNDSKPIGYWLRRADAVINAAVDRALAAQGFNRLEWQTLNTLAAGADVETLHTALHDFASSSTVDGVVRRFLESGWIESRDGLTALTVRGKAQHEVLAAIQNELRLKTMEAITPEDYRTALTVLEQLVRNLGDGLAPAAISRRTVEIRSYNLREGARDEFDRLMKEKGIPLLNEWNVDVVAFGSSPHDTSSYYLIRAYESVDDRNASQDAFYGSDQWRKGPREEIISHIESYTSVLLELDDVVVDALRRA